MRPGLWLGREAGVTITPQCLAGHVPKYGETYHLSGHKQGPPVPPESGSAGGGREERQLQGCRGRWIKMPGKGGGVHCRPARGPPNVSSRQGHTGRQW